MRRRVIALAGIGIGASLAGCGTRSDRSTPRPPEATVTVRLRNRDDQPREYEVVVNQGGSLTDSVSGDSSRQPGPPAHGASTVTELVAV
jgi:hypothetical protein